MTEEEKSQQKVDETLDLAWNLTRIHETMGAGIVGFERIVGKRVGVSTQFNSPLAGYQLLFALALSGHPLVYETASNKEIEPWNFDPSDMIEAKILKDTKILDLGCGFQPTFALAMIALGAETYTVDVVSSSDIAEACKFYGCDELLEKLFEHHIQLDLNNDDAADVILSRSSGEFDLVTSAHLYTGTLIEGKIMYGPRDLDKILIAVMKEEGIYYESLGGRSKIVKKKRNLLKTWR